MKLTGPDSKVLIVPGGLLLELFVTAQLASRVRRPELGGRIYSAIRKLRPDISEFSSFYALALSEQGNLVEARGVLEEFVESGGEESSLVRAILAKLLFHSGDPGWLEHANEAARLVAFDGGGSMQSDILKELPGFEESFGHTTEGV